MTQTKFNFTKVFLFFLDHLSLSYLYPVGSTDFSRLKSVALSIVPIELVHVWWKLLYCGSKAKNQSSKDCHHKGVDKKVIILKSTSQSLTCLRRCCTGWENWQNSTNFLVPLLSSKPANRNKLECGKIKNKSWTFVYILTCTRFKLRLILARSVDSFTLHLRCSGQKSK